MLEAYERLIHDAMSGDHTLFTTAEGIERLWEVSDPPARGPARRCSPTAGVVGARAHRRPDRPPRLAAAVPAGVAPGRLSPRGSSPFFHPTSFPSTSPPFPPSPPQNPPPTSPQPSHPPPVLYRAWSPSPSSTSPPWAPGRPAQALAETTRLAVEAERLGYHRLWVAEHHGMPAVASSAPAVLIAHLADATTTIRLGAGGVMLPNHAPLVIAEQFGTLEALHPGRIDLGLGRAPGTDHVTARALRRRPTSGADTFPDDVVELIRYLAPVRRAGHPPGRRPRPRLPARGVAARLVGLQRPVGRHAGSAVLLRLPLRPGHARCRP